jgi:hypothetical protein
MSRSLRRSIFRMIGELKSRLVERHKSLFLVALRSGVGRSA